MKTSVTVFALVILCSAALQAAEIYRYVDANGVESYTDLPLNSKAERIKTAETSPVNEAAKKDYGRQKGVHAIVYEKAEKYDLDPSLVNAVIKAESNGNPYAVSRKGAMGLMQLMPVTAGELQVFHPFDPEENIEGGAKYLKSLIDKFNGDLTLALAAYNAGSKAVEKAGAVPDISETRQYVNKVLSMYKGKTTLPVSKPVVYAERRPEVIYKVVTDDGTILFTNSPQYKKYPRL